MSEMRSRFKFRGWSVMVAAVLVLLWLCIPNRTPKLQLPTGSAFELVAVTHGTAHTMTVGHWLNRLRNRPVIKNVLQFFGSAAPPVSRQIVHSGQPTIVFWIDHTGSGLDISLSQSDWRATACDEHGVQAEVTVPFRNSYTPIMPWRMQGDPPSGKKLILDIYMRHPGHTNEWLHVGKFVTRNPAR
jgi:hypothetical protein